MTNPHNTKGFKRLLNSFIFSMNGIKACLRTEEAFRQEAYLSIICVPLGFYLGDTAVEKILLVGSILLLFIVELLNTAVERAIDRISLERHELSKEAKDMGSAAVFVAILIVILCWATIIIL